MTEKDKVLTTHPPLSAAHQGQVKVESSPFSLLVSKMEPIVTAIVGHAQEYSLNMLFIESV